MFRPDGGGAAVGPTDATSRARSPRRRELPIVLAASVAAAVCVIAARPAPNYDTYYALVWGRELVHGHLPSFTAFAAPTQHPLFNLFAAGTGVVFGTAADTAIVCVCAIAMVWLGYAVYRLGSAVATGAVGVVGAAFVMTSPGLLLFVSRGYVDIPFLALVFWAAVAVAERPANAARPMALLALAGLLRPEA